MLRATTIQEAEESPWPASMMISGVELVLVLLEEEQEVVLVLVAEEEDVGGGPEMER